MFVECVEQSSSNDLATIGNLSKENESIVCNEVLENEGISNMQSLTGKNRQKCSSAVVFYCLLEI